MKFIDPDGRPPSKAQIAALLAWAKADAAGKEIEEPDPPKKDNNSLLSIYFNRLLGAVGLSPDQWNSDDPAVLEDASQRRKATINTIDAFNETTLSFIPLGEVGYKAYRGKDLETEDFVWEAAAILPIGRLARIGKSFPFVSTVVRSAFSNRVGKRGFTEVGYQFQKHAGRVEGAAWRGAIPEGTTLNPAAYNKVGYEVFQEIWRAPGNFHRVGGFIEKRLPDGRGIRIQENGVFKGFLD